MTQQYYRHKLSGETYVVEVDEQHAVTAIAGPLHYSEVAADNLGQYDMVTIADPDDLEWYQANADDFMLVEL